MNISDLAISGGNPVFKEKLHVGRPNIGNKESFLARTNDILERRWLSNNGYYVQEFEKKIADYIGVKHCIAMCNATIALEITIRALDLKGEVIVPSFTFIATAHSLQWQEITPVFCDFDPKTHNIDPGCVEELITPKTTGILGVHLWGRACDVDALHEIANRRKLKILFDATHAFGCSHQGKMIGCFGEAEIFSFHATKFLNTFEGGAVTTNNDDLAGKIRLMKNFGFSDYDTVIYIGTNGKMSEISAAMGLSGLEYLDQFIETNLQNYRTYLHELKGIPGIHLTEYNKGEEYNYQYITIEIDEDETGISRDNLIKVLHAENIMARRYFFPGCHRMEPYRSYFPHARHWLPQTERFVNRVISLPTGTAINSRDVIKICSLLHFAVSNSAEITALLNEM